MVIRGCILLVLIPAAVLGVIQNGGFEIAEPNQPSPYFTVPLNWETENYAGLHNNFTPHPEWGQSVDWTIERPSEGSNFCLLSTGDALGPNSDSQILRASIGQTVYFASGDTLMGSYFFGTCDYVPYNDTANILLVPADPNDGLRNIILESICVADVGDFCSTEEWVPFSFTFNANTAGEYNLVCEVIDILDNKYKTYLAVDNLRMCYGTPLYGDINQDCGVDLLDIYELTHVWLSDCSDPNTYDPNYICDNADFDGSTIIDCNDLMLMSEHWLENYRAY